MKLHRTIFVLALTTVMPTWAAPADAASCGSEDLVAGKSPTASQDARGDLKLITDGAVGAEGTLWNAPVVVTLETPAGSVTYDLGEARQVSALVVQADANDTYKVLGSVDGTPSSYKPIVAFANVVNRGPGLRTRAIEIPPTTVRYLRVGEGEGDGFYSISEFAAYCRTPTPFPPMMRIADAPMAAGPTPQRAGQTETGNRPRSSPIGALQLVLGAAILLLAGARLSAKKRSPDETEVGAAGAALGADRTVGESKSERFFPWVLLLFFGSGCAALMYEIIWFQLLQLVLGSSAVSIGVLLGVFMGGMCIGSLALARFVSRRPHPLRVYALLEVGVGCCGLVILVAMPLVEGVYTTVVGHGVPGLLLRGFFAALCLLPPTVMMGATLPAVARWVRTTPRGVSWLGYFYAANTIGAVFGCLVAGFYLLRVFDLRVATFAAVALNAVVAVAAMSLARAAPRVTPDGDTGTAPTPAAPATKAGTWAVYFTIGLSGMSALGAEVIWTRLFSLLLSGNTYTFSIILAVFLIGIGLGSAAGAFIARRTSSARRALGTAQFLLIAAIGWTAWNITSSLPYWPVNPAIAASPWFEFQIDFVRSLWAILPAACLWGASFPLALAAVASESQDGGKVVGRIYAANTVGAIVGALVTSLVLIAAVGTQNGQRILVGLAGLGAIAALAPVFAHDLKHLRPTGRDALWVLVVLELASFVGRNVSPVPPLLIGRGWMSAAERHSQDRYLFVGEGMNSSPAVSQDENGVLSYHNAGKVQASSLPQDMRLQRMLGHLTTLVPSNPRSVLVVACGAGVTAGAASIDPRVERLTIAEIEPLVPRVVAKYFDDYNFNLVSNPKVHIEIDDARHFLNTTKEKFDAITSDPFDPWVKGAASLYTREFWELAKRHLNPGGVVTVFVQLYESGTAAVKSEMATFFEAFPRGIIWGNTVSGEGYDVVLSGQVEPPEIDVDHIDRLLSSPAFARVARSLREIGFNSATTLFSTFGGRAEELGPWLADAEVNRDSNLRLQFLAGLGMNANERVQIYREILTYRRFPEDLFVGSPERLNALRAAILEEQ
jgi:spermidine synthase